ncbi:MAG: uroporphyrinogen decarboxylase family protein [Gammaproteobacteria bacterium]|nr:MAG: uroporphyrinogen decarboxylase family protein [Gammaproteobacteria bacterium]
MTWTHRERILAALNHEEPDRVPIDFGSAGPTAIVAEAYQNLIEHLDLKHEAETLQQLKTQVYPDEAVLQRFDVDTRGIQPGKYENGHNRVIDAHAIMDEFGVTWRQTQGTRDMHFLHVDGPFYEGKLTGDAIDAFDWPTADNSGLTEGVASKVATIKAAGDHAVVLYLPGGFIHRGYAMRGMESFLKDLYRNTEAVCHLMERLCDYWIGVAERVIEAAGPENIDVVFFGEDLGTQNGCMFDPENIYARLMKPRHRRMIEAVKGPTDAKICFHCCGSAYHFLDHLIDIGVDALNPVQVTARNMEPERLKGEYGDRLSFWGGVNTQQTLPYGTAEEVRGETRRVIDILGEGGGYVLNAVHALQAEVPPANIVAMFETGAAHRYQLGSKTHRGRDA